MSLPCPAPSLYRHVVVIDLETTGIDPNEHEIMEFGAVIMQEGQIVDSFSELVATRKAPSLQVQNLTGIQPEDLHSARPLKEVFSDFLAFLEREDALYLAHQASFDRSFLQAADPDRFTHRMLDTVGLSRILLPTLQSHSLSFLIETLDLPRSHAHRALADCEATATLWNRLILEAMDLDPALLKEINTLFAPLKTHPYHDFFLRIENAKFAQNFGRDPRPFRDLFTNHRELIETKQPERDFDRDFHPLSTQKVIEVFADGGSLSRVFREYQSRDGQIDMAAEVTQAFSNSQHLMVEAPTGIGKSLAYLIPSILFSLQEGTPVILSTNTKNLQTQLFEKDIPLVREALGLEFKSALIKGRGNYLCLRKLLYLLDTAERELDNEDRPQIALLLNWATQTRSGDISECILSGRPDFSTLWAKVRTLGDECTGRACKQFHRCFLRRARALSLQADIVVANHALVFSELNMESSVLPEYRHIVFDEAHNLEAAATDHLTVEISHSRLSQVLNRLHRKGRRNKRGTGLTASIIASLESGSCTAQEDLAATSRQNCDTLLAAITAAGIQVLPFFNSLAGALTRGSGGGRQRFCAGNKREALWTPIDTEKKNLVSSLAAVMRSAEALVESLAEMPTGSVSYGRDFQRELEAVVQWLREIISDIEFVLAGSETNYVYWIEQTNPKHGGAIAMAAPLSIAEIMHDQVYARKASVVFSSATLTVRGTFTYLQNRLGIDRLSPKRLRTLCASSPFDYDEQCRVLVPTFLPEPGGDGAQKYEAELARLLEQVFRRTQGRGMVLFTSYQMLQNCHTVLEKAMMGEGIRLLAQGISGSREHITNLFTHDIHSVLLGTHSFWEGVDVAGESLSCLTIARLPFAVFTDPIIEARCEQLESQGVGAFMNYSVPSAVIRFKQGFGRLIRSRSDRGVVILADRRVVAKRYGKIFLDSLPAKTAICSDEDEFLAAIENFLGSDS